jgi:hypothetical protein
MNPLKAYRNYTALRTAVFIIIVLAIAYAGLKALEA